MTQCVHSNLPHKQHPVTQQAKEKRRKKYRRRKEEREGRKGGKTKEYLNNCRHIQDMLFYYKMLALKA